MRSPEKRYKSLWLGSLILVLVCGTAWADAPGKITGIELDLGNKRIVIAAKGTIGQHQARVVGQPNRLVMDFRDTGLGNFPHKIPGAQEINEIRVGSTDKQARVVVDFKNNPVPAFSVLREPDKIVVMFGNSLAAELNAPQAPQAGAATARSAQAPGTVPWSAPAAAQAAGVNNEVPLSRLAGAVGTDPSQRPMVNGPAEKLVRNPGSSVPGMLASATGEARPAGREVRVAQASQVGTPPASRAVGAAVKDDPPARTARPSAGIPAGEASSSGPAGAPQRVVREVRPPVTPPTPDPRLLVQEITELRFIQVGHNSRLIVRGGDNLDYRLNKISPTKVRLDLINAEIAKVHQKPLATDQFSTSVEMIIPGTQNIFVQLKDSVPYQVQKQKGVLMVDFPPPRFNTTGSAGGGRGAGGSATGSASRIIQEEQIRSQIELRNKEIERIQKDQERLQKQRGEMVKTYLTTPDPEVFSKPVTLDFQGITLKNAFRLLAEQAGLNVIIEPATTEGTTTLRLVDVPLGQVIDTLCTSYGLDRVLVGNVMRIGNKRAIKDWRDEKQKEYQLRVGELDKQITKNRAEAEKNQQDIEKMLAELKKLQAAPVDEGKSEDVGEAGCIDVDGEQICFNYATVRVTYAKPRDITKVLECVFNLKCEGRTGPGQTTSVFADSESNLQNQQAQSQQNMADQLQDQGFMPGSPGYDDRMRTLQREQRGERRTRSAEATAAAAQSGFRGDEAQIKLPFGTDPKLAKIIAYGMLWADEQNRMIFIKDTPERIAQMKKMIFSLDVPTPQVLIEARLVQAAKNWGRGIGVLWGGNQNQNGPLTDNRTVFWGVTGNQSGSPANTATGATTAGNDIPSRMAVDVPPAAIAGLSNLMGVGIQFGFLAGQYITQLDFRLQLGEATGQSKTIARPKVQVLSGQSANIKNGRTIAYSTISANGTQTQLVNVDLKLDVTPTIYADGRIQLKLNISDNDLGGIVNGQQEILTREAKTVMIVKDGDTAVIGGIIRKSEQAQRQGVPGLMNVPLFNSLFTNKNKSKDITELLVFITPNIVRRPPAAS